MALAPENEGTEVSLRDSLESAFQTEEEKVEAPEVKEDAVVDEKVEETLAEEKPAETPEPKPAGKPERGADGKFKPKAPKEEQVVTEEQPADAGQPKAKPPGTWSAAAREKWDGLPPDIQREVLRREKDIANGFTEIGKIRQFGQGMHDLWSPFQGMIAADAGGDAMKMTRDLFVTAAALYNGSPVQKVQVVAGMIKNFGVDLKMLDSMLAGEIPPSGGNYAAPPQHQPQDFNAAVQRAVQEHAATQQEAEWKKEIEEFANDAKNEFFDDVKDTMAELISVADRKGQKMSLQDAYGRAILLHDDISAIVKARSAKADAAKKTAAAQAARKKAVSIAPNSPSPTAVPAEDQSLRSDIADAVASLES